MAEAANPASENCNRWAVNRYANHVPPSCRTIGLASLAACRPRASAAIVELPGPHRGQRHQLHRHRPVQVRFGGRRPQRRPHRRRRGHHLGRVSDHCHRHRRRGRLRLCAWRFGDGRRWFRCRADRPNLRGHRHQRDRQLSRQRLHQPARHCVCRAGQQRGDPDAVEQQRHEHQWQPAHSQRGVAGDQGPLFGAAGGHHTGKHGRLAGNRFHQRRGVAAGVVQRRCQRLPAVVTRPAAGRGGLCHNGGDGARWQHHDQQDCSGSGGHGPTGARSRRLAQHADSLHDQYSDYC